MLAPLPRHHARVGAPLILLGMQLGACLAPEPFVRNSPPDGAVEAFRQARQLRAEGVRPDDAQLWRQLGQALRLAPDWVAPKRMQDDLLRSAHREVEALERRRFDLARNPGDAKAHYLVTRLEVGRDAEAFERVVRLDPDFAWGLYAWSWARSGGSDREASRSDWKRAAREARTPWEAAYFARGLANSLVGRDRMDEAVGLLAGILEGLELQRGDRAWLASQLAMVELQHPGQEIRRAGYQRAVLLLRGDDLADSHLEALVEALDNSGSEDDPAGYRLDLALGAHESPLRERLLTRRAKGDSADSSSAPRLTRGADQIDTPSRLFRRRQFRRAIEVWLASLPDQVLGPEGLPADPGLLRVVQAARALEGKQDDAQALRHLGQSLLEVGWYDSAGSVVSALQRVDPTRSVELARSVLSGRLLLSELQRALRSVKKNEPGVTLLTDWEDYGRLSGGPESGTLEDLLARWGYAFAECARARGVETSASALAEILVDSPRLGYGPFAELVHPGPRYSAADERAGLGREGALVPGLSYQMAAHNRFAIVGQVLGAEPDARVLLRLFVERRSGEHLGTAWQGTLAWCAGTNVRSGVGGGGAEVGGAALHEGYWIDLGQLRRSFGRWSALARQFQDEPLESELQRVQRILATRGLKLRSGPSRPRQRSRERRATRPVLGEATRVRLAVLRERAGPGELLGELSFTEYVDLVAKHEEGHLCDRTRFLPLGEKVSAWLGFAFDRGFSPRAIQERLEYRAQLTAMCVVGDPRLALVDLLLAVDSEDGLGLGHVPAYQELLEDLIDELDRRLVREPESWPRISRDHTLVHQLHHLSGEELRELALALARREGLGG